mgnify:CR=1 FL=1
MIKLKTLTLRAKLILAFCLIASFSLVSSGAAVSLFKLFQGQLLLIAKNQGEPLLVSTDIIEDIHAINLQLERIKSADTLSQRLIALEALENQWRDIILELDLIQSLNPFLSTFYSFEAESLTNMLVTLPTFTTIITELSNNQEQRETIHTNILKQQQKILAAYKVEILKNRQNPVKHMDMIKNQKLNLLTDIERNINQVSSLLLEALSSKHNEVLSLLARQSLIKLREVENLSKALDLDIQATTQAWLIHIKPYVASQYSVFQKGKRQLRLKKILGSHIKSHIQISTQIKASTLKGILYLKQKIVKNSDQLTKDVTLASKLIIALALICFISVFLIIWLFVSRRIIRPFIETSQSMQLLAQGETQITLPTSKDKEVQKMLQSLKVLQQYVIKVNDIAEKDSLTDIYNRRYFDNILRSAADSSSNQSAISLLMCDLDHFKPYNDYYGHQQGDHCLKFFAQILQRLCDSTSDHVCRYGGEEFAIIILNKPKHYADSLALLICSETSKALIPHKKSECADIVTVSIGVASIPVQEIKDIKRLINQADNALYLAKNDGRNCVSFESGVR